MNLTELRKSCLGNRVDEYSLEKVDIISPYISEGFFNPLIEELDPLEILIVTDISCSPNALQQVKEVLNNKNIKYNVRFAECNGIVHAKCYLFHWKNNNTNRFKRLLLWGSCNATEGGFKRNTEIFSWLLLSELDNNTIQKIKSYIIGIRENPNSVRSAEIKHEGLTLLLPAIIFCKPDSKEDTFDLWIQRGRLCHEFKTDSSFRYLKVDFKIKLPKNDFMRTLEEHGFQGSEQPSISFDYLRQNNNQDTTNDKPSKKWKAKYFVDTMYGLWTSEQCFNQNKNDFRKVDCERRRQEIDIIANATESQRKKWRNGFVEKLRDVNQTIENPHEYFHYIEGKFNVKKYREQLDKQLERHLLRSQDTWFKNAYISGFNFPDVPPIRKFHTNWEEFIQSFAASLFFEINKPRTQNLLAKTIRQFEIEADDSSEFLEELRSKWKDNENFRNALKNFHEPNQ